MVSSFIVEYWIDNRRYIAFDSVDDALLYAACYSSRNDFHHTYKSLNNGEFAPPDLYDHLRGNLAGIARVLRSARVYVLNGRDEPLLENSLDEFLRGRET